MTQRVGKEVGVKCPACGDELVCQTETSPPTPRR